MDVVPKDLKYADSHEWVRIETDNIIVVGITDYAQERLGALLTVMLPEVDEVVDVGDDICTLESDKTAVEVTAPVAGTIIEVNEDLINAPRLINADPYVDGWLFKIKVVDYKDFDQLLSFDEYVELLSEEEDEEEEDN